MKKIKFPKTKKIWLNGKLIDWEKAEIHILAHALHYGSAVFEGIRVYETKNGPAVFRLKDHIHRFFNSAKILKMKFPFSKKEIEEAVLKTVRVNKLNQGYIRPIAFYGYGKMGLDPQGAPLNIAIICWPWGAYLGKKETIKVKTSAYRRLPPFSCPMEAKVSGYYVNSILATFEARDKGYDEALLLDYQNYIAEGPGENIFLVKKRKLFTPALGAILPGITRDTIIKIAKGLKIPVAERKITLKELKSADELFFVGTAAEVSPIGKIDNTLINNGAVGELTSEVKKIFQRIVKGEEKKYLKWLSFV